ncbi:T9SS type A sorting domain-containing protein [Flavobacterium sp. 25HG05S-40]|uniref:T9SS type A sorting domain-containing protein n=1 Tax=Flavobacterium sp. 25HG05S-40 TaxID=3458682 RepID=UPI0040441552
MKFKIRLLTYCFCVVSKSILSAQTIDTNFGSNGFVTTDFANDADSFGTMATLPDGKIILFGSSKISGIVQFGNSNASGTNVSLVLAMVKYNTDGSLDTSFGLNGKVYYSVDTYQNFTPSCSVAQNDGKVIVGGRSNGLLSERTVLLRFLPDGKLDSGFGVNGSIALESENIYDLFIDANNKIIAVGEKNQDGCIERLNTNGFFDPTFGILGATLLDDNGSRLIIRKGKALSDGSILCFGDSSNNSFADTVVFFKFSATGTYDSGFGIKRIVNGQYENDYDMVQFEVLPDSSMLVLTNGAYYNANFTNFYNSRLYKIDLNGVTVPSFTNVPFYEMYDGFITILSNQNILITSDTNTSGVRNTILTPNGGLVSQSAPVNQVSSFTSLVFNNYQYIGYSDGDYRINGYIIDNTLSNNPADELSLSLSPNPVKDFVTISLESITDEDTTIEVYSLTGSLITVYNKKRFENSNQVFYENISRFTAGIYFFKITSGTRTKTIKVIKS